MNTAITLALTGLLALFAGAAYMSHQLAHIVGGLPL